MMIDRARTTPEMRAGVEEQRRDQARHRHLGDQALGRLRRVRRLVVQPGRRREQVVAQPAGLRRR